MTDDLLEDDLPVSDDLFELLSVSQQQAIARGDVSLDDLIERITAPGQELCPRCAARNVSPKYQQLGLCATCARVALNEKFKELIAELEAKREAARLKKIVQRIRDELDPSRPRRRRDTR